MKQNIFLNIFILLISLFVLQAGLGYTLIRRSYLSETRQSLQKLTDRVKSDLEFNEGKWNIDKYLSDPLTPHPQGSSGFPSPLYIVASDGYVLERNLPVTGFLDASDFNHLMAFTSPTFIDGGTSERWRVFSRPLLYNGETQGVITVAIYRPVDIDLQEIDKKLIDSSLKLEKKLTYHDDSIDISQIDIRNLKYDVAFEIVSKHNKVLLNNGRTPSFIDKSYVYDVMDKKEKVITDTQGGQYLLVFTPLIDSENKKQAIVVAGESLAGLNRSLQNYLLTSLVLSSIILLPLSFILTSRIVGWVNKGVDAKTRRHHSLPRFLSFDKKKGILNIDGVFTSIPYASHQYYMARALFSFPQKRWEVDELLSRMGETIENGSPRTVYDTAIALNKKAGCKLVIYNRKTYQLNPIFAPLLK